MFFISKILFFLFCINISQSAFASWSNIETEHFRFVIDSEHIETGKYIAHESERAYEQLQKIYTEFPKYKILIVVEHRTDLANGSATNFPYPHIIIYPSLPQTYSSIGEYKEWVYELVLHELVHFLSFSPVHGVYKPFKWLLGSYISPNFIMLPAWWHEGLAVHLETHLTHGGRMRSAQYQEMFRALSGRLATGQEDLARINERYIPSFPYGQRPYFFGSLVMNQALQDSHPENLNATVQSYSRTLPPYNIYSPTKKHLKINFRKARKSVKNYTYPESDDFKWRGEQSRWLSPTLLLTLYQNKNLFHLILKHDTEKPKAKPEVLLAHKNAGSFEVSPDGQWIVFDAIAPYKRRYQTSDLFLFDLESKTKRRLTEGQRLREASFSKDQKSLVAVGLEMNHSRLCLVQIDDKTPQCEELYRPSLGARISFPYFFDNDQKVLFIVKESNKKSELLRLHLATKEIQKIDTSAFAEIYRAQILELEDDLSSLILHALKKGSTRRQVYVATGTAGTTGAEGANVTDWSALSDDPVGLSGMSFGFGKLAKSRITPQGFRTQWETLNLEKVSPAPASEIIAPETQTQDKDYSTYSLNSNFIKSDQDLTPSTQLEIKGDSIWPYFLPHYWIPFIYPNYGGFSDQYMVTLSTGSTDPLRRHSYNLSLARDSISNRLSGSATYVNYAYQHAWGASVSQSESPLNSTLSRTYQRANIFTDLELVELDSNLGGISLQLGAEFNNSKLSDVLSDIKTTGLSARLNYDDVAMLPADVAPTFGQFMSLSFSHFLSGSDFYDYNYAELYFEKYFSKYLAPPQTSWKLFGKAIHSDQFMPLLLAPVNQSGYFAASRNQRGFVIRGYPTGILRAYEGAYNLGLEFNFPILNVFKAPVESLPLFFRRVYGNFFVDYGQVKGTYFDGSTSSYVNTDFDRDFAGYGFEIHTDWTLMHYVPIKLSLGVFTPIKTIPGSAEENQIFLNVATPAIPH